jgi:hypothetical protein
MNPIFLVAQDQYRLSLETYQEMENNSLAISGQISLPFADQIVVMGGLNDLDGMGNYFNVFGSKLVIDDIENAKNGIKYVILRREDGRNFYEIYPSLRAKLIPLSHEQEVDF